MKFNISRPPTGGGTKEQLERLTSWLYTLAESLNVTLANLSEDNFSNAARKKIFERTEEKDDNI